MADGQAAATPERPYRLSVALDAVTKLSHYTNCGAASRNISPQLCTYFGSVDSLVGTASLAGTLNLKSTMQGFGLQDAEPGADENAADHGVCKSSLHCARPEASSSSGPCDIHGVCGAVCVHTVPLRGMFCDMRTPEQFAYYLLLLRHLIERRPDLKDVYMDFGCRIRRTWENYVHANPDLPPEAKDLRIMVTWFHGSGHDVACQLVNSGRYSEDAGRRVGEEIEQLWGLAKVGMGLNSNCTV